MTAMSIDIYFAGPWNHHLGGTLFSLQIIDGVSYPLQESSILILTPWLRSDLKNTDMQVGQ